MCLARSPLEGTASGQGRRGISWRAIGSDTSRLTFRIPSATESRLSGRIRQACGEKPYKGIGKGRCQALTCRSRSDPGTSPINSRSLATERAQCQGSWFSPSVLSLKKGLNEDPWAGLWICVGLVGVIVLTTYSDSLRKAGMGPDWRSFRFYVAALTTLLLSAINSLLLFGAVAGVSEAVRSL